MKLLDLTLPTAAENLALDEALLDAAEQDAGPSELLRILGIARSVGGGWSLIAYC